VFFDKVFHFIEVALRVCLQTFVCSRSILRVRNPCFARFRNHRMNRWFRIGSRRAKHFENPGDFRQTKPHCVSLTALYRARPAGSSPACSRGGRAERFCGLSAYARSLQKAFRRFPRSSPYSVYPKAAAFASQMFAYTTLRRLRIIALVPAPASCCMTTSTLCFSGQTLI
jgi:hypothetical protein